MKRSVVTEFSGELPQVVRVPIQATAAQVVEQRLSPGLVEAQMSDQVFVLDEDDTGQPVCRRLRFPLEFEPAWPASQWSSPPPPAEGAIVALETRLELRPLSDVDDQVLAPFLDQPLHSIRMRGRLEQQGEHR